MSRAFIGLGSNMGDRERLIRSALDSLNEVPGTGVIITCAAMGLLYSVTRHHHQPETQLDPAPAESDWNTDSLALAAAH